METLAVDTMITAEPFTGVRNDPSWFDMDFKSERETTISRMFNSDRDSLAACYLHRKGVDINAKVIKSEVPRLCCKYVTDKLIIVVANNNIFEKRI